MTTSLGIGASAGAPRVAVELATPQEKQQDAVLAMQDAAARTGENAPRAGTHLENLESPIDRFVERRD